MDIVKFILGKLVDKGRKLAADKLKEGDVTDEQFRGLIEREIDEIKAKLDGLARANLLASISFFKEGLVYLYKVLDLRKRKDDRNVAVPGAGGITEENIKASLGSSTASVKTVSLTTEMRGLQRVDQDDQATRALSDAQDRFKDARRKATEAFSNEALSTSDRILAMQFRVMATLLEKVDNLADVVAACRLCLKELHSMKAVQESFHVQLQQGFKSWFKQTEREEIISSVCRVNRVIYEVMQMVVGGSNLLLWPCIDTAEGKVDPLRDSRVVETLRKLEMEQLCVTPWSFGQEGEEEQKLKGDCYIATNTQGQLIVLDAAARDIKVFTNSGKYLYSSRRPMDFINQDAGDSELGYCDRITTDRDDNIYLLIKWRIYRIIPFRSTMFVFDKHMILHHKFNVKTGLFGYSFTVDDNNKVFILVVRSSLQVHDKNGDFVHSFGEGILKSERNQAACITAVNGDRVMVLCDNFIVHVFSEAGDHISQFSLKESMPYFPRSIAFHRSTQHVVVLSTDSSRIRMLLVYTKDGVCAQRIHLHTEYRYSTRFVVMEDGHVAVFDPYSCSILLIG